MRFLQPRGSFLFGLFVVFRNPLKNGGNQKHNSRWLHFTTHGTDSVRIWIYNWKNKKYSFSKIVKVVSEVAVSQKSTTPE